MFCCLIRCRVTDDDTVGVGNIEVYISISKGKSMQFLQDSNNIWTCSLRLNGNNM